MTRRAYVERELCKLRKNAQRVLHTIQEERHSLNEQVSSMKAAYMEGGEDCFGALMAVTTRSKVHRIAVDTLGALKRHDTSVTVGRLDRLVRIHLTQIWKLDRGSYAANRAFYTEMVSTLDLQIRWLKALL